MTIRGVCIDLVRQARHDGEDGGHESDATDEKGPSTEAIDEQPGNEGGHEEPSEEGSGHECGGVPIETKGGREQEASIAIAVRNKSQLTVVGK